MGNQKFHFVCLACRRSVKRAATIEWTGDWNKRTPHTSAVACAQCGGEMAFAGKKFAAPRRRDDAGWKKLRWMIDNGWRGYDWPTSPGMNLGEVRESLRANRAALGARTRAAKERLSFVEAERDARRNFRNSRTARKRARLELREQRRYQDAVLARVNKSKSAQSHQAGA